MKAKDLKIKISADTTDFEAKLEKVTKALEELSNTKIIVNIETRNTFKQWFQFWIKP